MPLTTTEFADAMKIYYLGPLNDQIDKSTVLLDRLERNSQDVSGEYAYVPVITGRNPGVGSRKDTATTGPSLPTAGRQTYDTATYKMALHYGRGSISGPVMRASKNNAGAFAKALDTELKGLSERLPQDLNRQLWNDGTGRAATIDATQTTSTGISVASTDPFHMKVGDRVHGGTIAAFDAKPDNGTTVSAIYRDSSDASGTASSTKHFIVLAAATGATMTVTTDAFYFGAKTSMTVADSSQSQDMYGILALVDDGAIGADLTLAANAFETLDGSLSFGSIDRTSVTSWRSTVLQNPDSAGTNRAFTKTLMEQGYLSCVIVGGADERNLEAYTNAGLWSTFGLMHVGDRRYNDYKETLEGGWTALMYNGRPVLYDRDAPRDAIFWLHMPDIFLLTQSGYEMMDDDGSQLARISDYDAYEFTLYRDCQLGARRLNTHCKIDDLTSSVNIEYDS